jgi:hypothetical protein
VSLNFEGLLETWSNVKVRSVVGFLVVFGNLSSVSGGLWSTCNVMETDMDMVQCFR